MIPLIKLRENLKFSRELQDMIEVLKGATASQFRSLQSRRKGFEDFKLQLHGFLTALDARNIRHPFLRERANLPKAIVMITSDEGFVGGLNARVVNTALEQATGADDLIVLGERGARYLSDTQSGSFTVLPGIGDDITYRSAVVLRNLLISRFLEKRVGSILVVYTRFLSLTVQDVDVARVLPCGDIFGQKQEAKKRSSGVGGVFLTEPTPGKVVDYMVRAWLMQRLYDMFWESKLSECAARIIHLEGSHEEILASTKKLMHEYFKNIHAKSDKNIREIFASRIRWHSAPEEGQAERIIAE